MMTSHASAILLLLIIPLQAMKLEAGTGAERPVTSYIETDGPDDVIDIMDVSTLDRDDPCLAVSCGRGRRCDAADAGASCVCLESCPNRFKPVCGTDGMIYPNHCHLHMRACVDARHIGISRMAECLAQPEVLEEDKAATNHISKTTFPSITSHLPISHTASSDVITQLNVSTLRTRQPSTPSINVASDEHTAGSIIAADSDVTTTESDVIELRPSHLCSLQKFQKMKDTLLTYTKAQLESGGGRPVGHEYVISHMFSQYDVNNDGQLAAVELRQVADKLNLSDLQPGCDLTDLVHFDDADADGALNINEFYTGFNKLYSIAMVSLDKALQVNQLSAVVGDNVEVKCDVTGSPAPNVVWRRTGRDLLALADESLRVFPDGSLYLSHVQLIHAGNYTCHARGNTEVQQTHVISVQTPPTSEVNVKLQNKPVRHMARIQCHVTGTPTPNISWLKNESPIGSQPGRYDVTAGGSSLLIGPLTVSDTGAYMCQASNAVGRARDVSSLLVQQQYRSDSRPPEPSVMVLHDWGIAVYTPSYCRLQHQIRGTDVIAGTQDTVCGGEEQPCHWGTAVAVADVYVYVSQPLLRRVLVVSRRQRKVVDVVDTDELPVDLHHVERLDQVWVLNWRSRGSRGVRTVQVIRHASQTRRHHTVHLQPIGHHLDLVVDVLLPPPKWAGPQFAYVTHSNHRGMYKVDMTSLEVVRAIDLSAYDCVPQTAQFASSRGFVVLSCAQPVTSRPNGQLLYDQLTDTVVSVQRQLTGRPLLTPDSASCVTVTPGHHLTTLAVQRVNGRGLEFAFDVRTPLNISDVTFHPSRSGRGYDLYATAVGAAEVMVIDLQSGKVDILTGLGHSDAVPSEERWGRPARPLRSAGRFQHHLAVTDSDSLVLLNSNTRTETCRVAGLTGVALPLWLSPSQPEA